ncbi:MAG: hypothetical protein H6622_10950 [Halobacteriovoraceae bacterium]|nr:hypothetical protein [Halobacteriovoraceae bacterium]
MRIVLGTREIDLSNRVRERIYIQELAEKLSTDIFGVIAKAIKNELRLYVNLNEKRSAPELPEKNLLSKTGNHFNLISKEKDTFEISKEGLEEVLQLQKPIEEDKYIFIDYLKRNEFASLCNDNIINLDAIFSFVDDSGLLSISPRDELVLLEGVPLLLFRECIVDISDLSGAGVVSAYSLFEEGKNTVQKDEVMAKFSEVRFGKVDGKQSKTNKYYKLFEKFDFVHGDSIDPILSQSPKDSKAYQFILGESEEGEVYPSLNNRIKLCVIKETT